MMNQFTATVLCPVTAITKRGWVVLLLMSAAACGGSTPGSLAPAPTVPGSAAPYAVSGRVMERTSEGVRPSAGALVFAWVQQKNRGFQLGQYVPTDAEGRYRLVDVPNGFIVPFAQKSGYDQPCAAAMSLSADATVDMELVPSDSPLPSTIGASTTLSGTFFETTPEGRRPIPGVRINWGGDLLMATTHSDAAGRYAFCHLPTSDELPFSQILAFKDGYKVIDLYIPLHGDMSLDLEMKP